MAGRLKRFPEYGVTLIIFSGKVEHDEAVELISKLDQRDRNYRITYLSEDVEVGRMIADIPQFKRAVAEKQRELPDARGALVCGSSAAREYLDFLKRYWATGDAHPTMPRAFPSLGAACDWLGLPDGACEALTEEVNRASPEDRRGRDNADPKPGGSPDQASH